VEHIGLQAVVAVACSTQLTSLVLAETAAAPLA
jgi:hypothetical protein